MKDQKGAFGFSVVEDQPFKQTATVTVGKEHIQALYQEALVARQKLASTYGFSQGRTPIYYIEQNFKSTIVDHLKELLFTHCVVDHLYDSLSDQKLVVVGDPDLVAINLDPAHQAEFIFKLSNISFDQEERWKRLHLKPLARKKYKDLDRQVEAFIRDEREKESKADKQAPLAFGDWVNFEIALLDKSDKDLIRGYKSDVWIALEEGENDKDLHDLLLGKQVGDSFVSDSVFLRDYVSSASDIAYHFQVTIKQRLHGGYFSLDLFKHQFGLESDIEMPAKLIEVFSMRNDIPLRRETIEAVFKLLHKQYYFMLPPHLLEQQRKMVLEDIQNTPDYIVYKSQPDFKEQVRALAEKQLKEAIITDAIAYQEGISVTDTDICAYLNLLKQPRMKTFMYFGIPEAKTFGHISPVSQSVIRRYCLREKTLNYLIKQITQPRS